MMMKEGVKHPHTHTHWMHKSCELHCTYSTDFSELASLFSLSNRSCWISSRYTAELCRMDCSTAKLSNSVKPLFLSPETSFGLTDPIRNWSWEISSYTQTFTHEQYFCISYAFYNIIQPHSPPSKVF